MKLTTFGGPDDLYDRAYHQAYLPEPSRATETPSEYYHRVKDWVRSLLRAEMATATEWPVMEQWYYRSGDVKNKIKRWRKVGLSYYLADEPYVAWDIEDGDYETQRMARRGMLYVDIDYPGATIRAHVTDHGNSGAAGSPVLDVSPVVYAAIKPYWPKDVAFRLVVITE